MQHREVGLLRNRHPQVQGLGRTSPAKQILDKPLEFRRTTRHEQEGREIGWNYRTTFFCNIMDVMRLDVPVRTTRRGYIEIPPKVQPADLPLSEFSNIHVHKINVTPARKRLRTEVSTSHRRFPQEQIQQYLCTSLIYDAVQMSASRSPALLAVAL